MIMDWLAGISVVIICGIFFLLVIGIIVGGIMSFFDQ